MGNTKPVQSATMRARRVSSDLGDLLLDLPSRLLPDRVRGLNATATLTSPEEAWTIEFRGGRALVGLGGPAASDTVVRADRDTLLAVHSGLESGVDAFLDGRVVVRGNLNLALRLESLFEPYHARPVGTPVDRTVTVNGREVSLLEAGPATGEPVLLLHGLGATKASFLPTMRALAQARYRVIVPDLLGHGDTAKPVLRYTASTFGRFATGLLDAMEIDRAHIVGNSLGGRIGLEVAFAQPDRVRSLSLLCPAVALLKRRWAVPVVRRMRSEIGLVPHRFPHGGVVASMRSMFADPNCLPRAWYDAGADEFLRIFRSPRARYALYDSLRNIYLDEPLGERGFWTRLERMEVPSLFLWGDADPLVPAAFARSVNRYLPSARSEVLRNCGHVPQFEQPARVHRKLRDFLAAA